jgi:hypothetical protein
MVKTVWECETCGEQFNSRAARKYHKEHNCKGAGGPPVEPPVEPPAEQPPDEPPVDQTAVKKEPVLTPKEQFERDHNVVIPDFDPLNQAADEPVVDPGAATFDGEDWEIPVVFIWILVAVGLIAAGYLLLKERISNWLKNRKPPAMPVIEPYEPVRSYL